MPILFKKPNEALSDWIAHGLLDSIVDAFFPILNSIEKEVKALDGLGHGLDEETESDLFKVIVLAGDSKQPEGPGGKVTAANVSKDNAKVAQRFKHLTNTLHGHLMHSAFGRWLSFGHMNPKIKEPVTAESMGSLATLLRMSSTRRIVTGLGRLLAGKMEVVGRIQKRLTIPARGGGAQLGHGSEISIYVGDVLGKQLTKIIGIL